MTYHDAASPLRTPLVDSPTSAPDEDSGLAFDRLAYSVHGKSVLHEVTGFCPPRQLTAIMGSSGAGKSTLLDVPHEHAGLDTRTAAWAAQYKPSVHGIPTRILTRCVRMH